MFMLFNHIICNIFKSLLFVMNNTYISYIYQKSFKFIQKFFVTFLYWLKGGYCIDWPPVELLFAPDCFHFGLLGEDHFLVVISVLGIRRRPAVIVPREPLDVARQRSSREHENKKKCKKKQKTILEIRE